MNKIKKCIIAILVIVVLFGLLGCFRMFFYRVSVNTEIYYKQEPLRGVERIVVDSKGNMYFSLSSLSSVQVYDENGIYLYGISFENTPKGSFDFSIDKHDNIHVFSEGKRVEYIFSGKKLEKTNKLDEKEIELLFDVYDRTSKLKYTTNGGITYQYVSENKEMLLYSDENDNLIHKIAFDVVTWPWSYGVYLSFAFLGMLILTFLLLPKETIEKLKSDLHN